MKSKTSDAVTFLARHFVSLCVVSRCEGQVGPDRFFAASGTLISFRGLEGVLTAGHVVYYLETAMNDSSIIKLECWLVDTFGPDRMTDMGIPYNLRDSPRVHFDKDGLDFGVLFINENQSRLIAKHNIVAVTEEAARNEPPDLDVFWLLGLPAEHTSPHVSEHGTGSVSLSMLRLVRRDDEMAKENADFPRFVGEIQGELPLESIEGMSGGPIFGFCSERPEKYWIVALQSSWLKSKKLAYACPITHILNVLNLLHQRSVEALSSDEMKS